MCVYAKSGVCAHLFARARVEMLTGRRALLRASGGTPPPPLEVPSLCSSLGHSRCLQFVFLWSATRSNLFSLEIDRSPLLHAVALAAFVPRPLRFRGPAPLAFDLVVALLALVLTGLGLQLWVLPWPFALRPLAEWLLVSCVVFDAFTSFFDFTYLFLEILFI